MTDKEEAARAENRNNVKKLVESTDWLSLRELYANRAKMFKLKYDAMREAGFDANQAFSVCWKEW